MRMIACGYCGKEVPQIEGKRERRYCDNGGVCKQLAYRKRKQAGTPEKQPINEVQQHHYTVMLAELVELREKFADQAQDLKYLEDQEAAHLHTIEIQKQEIASLEHHYHLARQFQDAVNGPTEEDQTIKELQAQVADLQQRIENEKTYLSDTKARHFKSWLKKQPSSPWRVRFLSDQLVPAKGTHAHYLAHMKRLQMDEEEQADFTRLWRLFVSER